MKTGDMSLCSLGCLCSALQHFLGSWLFWAGADLAGCEPGSHGASPQGLTLTPTSIWPIIELFFSIPARLVFSFLKKCHLVVLSLNPFWKENK